jgi:cytoskeleton protein RodZ
MVAALEEDDYEAFPSATFVSGYLRSYARILGLPEEKFAKPASSNIEPPSLVSTIGSEDQVNSRDLPVRLVTYLLVAAVLVSVGMWWFSGQSNSDTFTVGPEQEVNAGNGDMGLSVPEQSQDTAESQIAAETESGSAVAETTEQDALSTDTGMEEGDEQAQDQSQDQATTTEESTATAESSPSQEKVSSSQEKSAPPPITPTTPVSSLELRFSADCWTEISDSAGRNLAYGLVKAGQTLKLKGEAPFRVFLGYAPGVRVYYNGELFDHTPFQRREIARFRVGRAEHNVPGSR